MRSLRFRDGTGQGQPGSAWGDDTGILSGLASIAVIGGSGLHTLFEETLREYVSRMPLDSVDNWPVHIAGQPPGALPSRHGTLNGTTRCKH